MDVDDDDDGDVDDADDDHYCFPSIVVIQLSGRTESARAVTGRRCPHSGMGEDFLVSRPGPLKKTGVTREWKVVDKIHGCQNLANGQG